MRRFALFTTLAALTLLVGAAHAAIAPGPYYARGTFFCASGLPGTSPPDTCWCYSPAQQLFDDGAHGDGAAGDGVYGANIAITSFRGIFEFKIGNADWTFSQPSAPCCAFYNGYLWPNFPGEIIHFTLDTATPAGGWVPEVGVANDHSYPSGFQLEVIGSAPEIGNWNWGLPADHAGPLWSRTAVIATPGTYEYKFRCLGTWNYANFGLNYNNIAGVNASFTTTVPNEPILFQFDESRGRLRAVHYDVTPARRNSWGSLKAAYR